MNPVLISGMHRSGTSAVARLVQRLGLNIGSDLLPAVGDNKYGYFEEAAFVRFHDQLITRLFPRQTLFPTWLPLASPKGEWTYTDQERAEASSIWEAHRQAGGVSWKDPRTSLFLDLWKEILGEAKVIICLRHPYQVHRSLLRRGETFLQVDYGAAILGWSVYNRRILQTLALFPKEQLMVLDVDALLKEGQSLAESLGRFLGVSIPAAASEAIAPEEFHFEEELKHALAHFEEFFPETESIYRQLQHLRQSDPLDLQSGSFSSSPVDAPASLHAAGKLIAFEKAYGLRTAAKGLLVRSLAWGRQIPDNKPDLSIGTGFSSSMGALTDSNSNGSSSHANSGSHLQPAAPLRPPPSLLFQAKTKAAVDVVIVGTDFCGSTLLGSILNRHPEVLYAGEIAQLTKYQRDLFQTEAKQDPVCLVCESSGRRCSRWTPAILHQCQEVGIAGVHAYLRAQMGKRIIVDGSKYPAWLKLSLLERKGKPLPKVILSVRNPYAICAHAKQSRRSMGDAARMWRDIYWDTLCTCAALNIDHLIVRYEDLISPRQKAKSVRRLTDFLGIDSISAIEVKAEAEAKSPANSSVLNHDSCAIGGNLAEINQSRSMSLQDKDLWQEILSDSEISDLIYAPGLIDTATLLGYNLIALGNERAETHVSTRSAG